jgi:phosphocarrier protein
MPAVEVLIQNRRGLHARAAARFVKTADGFTSEISVCVTEPVEGGCAGGLSVSGRSIMGLMMLAAGPGTRIRIQAEGDDADQSITALVALINAKFDEE